MYGILRLRPRPPQSTAIANVGISAIFVGAAIASAPTASATTCTTESTMYGRNGHHSRRVAITDAACTVVTALLRDAGGCTHHRTARMDA